MSGSSLAPAAGLQHSTEESAGIPPKDFSRGTIGHLRAYTDLTEGSNLEMGASFARGHNDLGRGLTTRLYGADVTYRWKPLTRAIYRSFVGRSELMWSRRDQPMGVAQAFGTFVSGDYQFARRWVAGGRFDSAERGREVNVRDRGWSAVLTFWPSEFSQLRSQYRRTRFGDRDDVAHELFLQVLFTIGNMARTPSDSETDLCDASLFSRR